MRKSFVFLLATLAATALAASTAQAESMGCGDNDPPLTHHDYIAAPGDILHPKHLEVNRPFALNGKMEVLLCNANLRVRTSADAAQARLTVDFDDEPSGHTMTDYIHTLRIQPDSGTIQLRFPKGAHATVVLTLPMGPSSESELTLGHGDLDFDATGTSGKREINIGMGHMRLALNGDKSYSNMEINIGMGTLHDHRPGGHDGHFVVAKEYEGTGSGSLEINVGMGSLDIHNN